MSKLSNIDLYKYAQGKYDKYNTPYVTRRYFQWVYSQARSEWFRLKYKDYEVSEAVRSDLRPFNRSKDFLNTSRINLNEVTPGEKFITTVYADFEFSCNGSDTVYTRQVKPLSKDEAATKMTDPFNQPNNEFPFYTDENDGQPYLQILSETAPIVTTVGYLKEPDDYKLLDDPNGFTEENESSQYEILDLAVRSVELTVENFSKFQSMREKIMTNGG